MSITITNEDNMALMSRYPDNQFDLAIVDPPYGINMGEYNRTKKDKAGKRHKAKKWDDGVPDETFFNELFRVSENQIVWGGNYFMPLAKKETPNLKTIEQFNEYINDSIEKWIFWYKQNPVPNFADGELAWISNKLQAAQYDFRYYGNLEGKTSTTEKIHPTQKPISLYEWILMNYAKPGDKILDTHLGSGSIAIACHNLGFDLTACELDTDYYNAAIKRLKQHQAQLTMF